MTLEGAHVRLEPLGAQHRDGLVEAVSDGWPAARTRLLERAGAQAAS